MCNFYWIFVFAPFYAQPAMLRFLRVDSLSMASFAIRTRQSPSPSPSIQSCPPRASSAGTPRSALVAALPQVFNRLSLLFPQCAHEVRLLCLSASVTRLAYGLHLQQAFFVSHAQWHAQIGCAPGGTASLVAGRPVWRLVNDSCLGCVRNKKGSASSPRRHLKALRLS